MNIFSDEQISQAKYWIGSQYSYIKIWTFFETSSWNFNVGIWKWSICTSGGGKHYWLLWLSLIPMRKSMRLMPRHTGHISFLVQDLNEKHQSHFQKTYHRDSCPNILKIIPTSYKQWRSGTCSACSHLNLEYPIQLMEFSVLECAMLHTYHIS